MHLAVTMLLIRLGVAPLMGNAVAFCAAFMISFCGHHFYAFAGHGATASQAFRRFAMTAATGFLVNETLLFLLLATDAFSAETAILMSTAFAALSTFALSRHWAFPVAGRGL